MVLICQFENCGKQLSSKYTLKRHIESHHFGIRKFSCDICFRKFASKQNLKDHMYLHVRSDSCAVGIQTDERVEIQVPKLTDMLANCTDPDLRPFARTVNQFPFESSKEVVDLPPLEHEI